MKKITLLLLPFLLSWQSENTSHLSGNLTFPENSTLQSFYLSGSDTTFTLTANDKNHYSLHFTNREVPFYMLNGKLIQEENQKWQFATPIYIKHNDKTTINLHMKDFKVSVETNDKNNQAIQECKTFFNESTQKVWMRVPSPENLKSAAQSQVDFSKEVVEKYHPEQNVAEFLISWGYLQYLTIVNAAKQTYKYSGKQLPEDILDGFPKIPEFLDKPFWSFFGGSSFRISDYIKRNAKTAEEQLEFLKANFHTPSIILDQTNQIVSCFIFDCRYSEENYKRLEKLTKGLPNRESTLENYKKTRFARTETGTGTGR